MKSPSFTIHFGVSSPLVHHVWYCNLSKLLPLCDFILPMLYSHQQKFETPGRTITLQLPQCFFQALPPCHAMHWHRYRRQIRWWVRRGHGRDSRGKGLGATFAAFPSVRKRFNILKHPIFDWGFGGRANSKKAFSCSPLFMPCAYANHSPSSEPKRETSHSFMFQKSLEWVIK